MVNTMLFNDLFDIQNFFYSWPPEKKPPLEGYPVYGEDESIIGFAIQMALAGFSKEDISVWWDEKLLHIEGDNTKNDKISNKFKSKFTRELSYSKDLDPSNAKVVFENGMLLIELPVIEKKAVKNYLLGG